MPETNVTVPADPSPQITAVVAAVLRLILIISGAAGVTWLSWLNASTVELIIPAVGAVAGSIWALYEVWRQANLRYTAAVASARGGTAVEHVDYSRKGYKREKGAPKSSIAPIRVRLAKRTG